MSQNPFDEPGDQDRTIIRPMPGGTRRAAQPTAAAAPPGPPDVSIPPRAAVLPAASAPSGPDLDAVQAGDGPLAVAAAPLLYLLARLRNAATPPDPGDMRERTRRELRAFERRATERGVPADQLRLAHYALCAALDDVVLNTPWGGQGRWHDEPLARVLHDDDRAGRGFFEQLRTLRDAMPGARPVVELMFSCLSLGMMGPYRAMPDGPAQLERVRHHLFKLITKASPPPEPALAADTMGIDARCVPRRGGVPVWVGASAAAALVAAAYVACVTTVNAKSDDLYQAALVAPPAAMPALVRPAATPPPPPPPEPQAGPAERLRAALAGQADVEVVGTPAATILRLPAHALFPAANATLGASPVLEAVAQALRPEAGPVRIVGYTDSQPARSVGFPSNFALSAARAKAVRAALARTLPDPARLTAEGRAGADPVASNATADGREHNRRIDIVLPARS